MFFTMKKGLEKDNLNFKVFSYIFNVANTYNLYFQTLGTEIQLNICNIYKDCCLYFKFYYDKQLDNSKSTIVQKENEHGRVLNTQLKEDRFSAILKKS